METIKDEIPPDPPKLERSNRFYIHNNICNEEQKERHEIYNNQIAYLDCTKWVVKKNEDKHY